MGDRSYMIVTVDDCPTKQRKVAQLLADYDLTVNRWSETAGTFLPQPQRVALGEAYTVEEISLGSATELAGSLIETAPRCSFCLRQDPHYSVARGDVVAYTPKLGRFDGECDGDGAVVKDFGEISQMLDQAQRAGIGGDLGQRAVIEVAYGVPWLNDWNEIDPDGAKRKLWCQVIDAVEADAAQRRQATLEGLLDDVNMFAVWAVTRGLADRGLAAEAHALRDTPIPAQFDAARELQDACKALLNQVAARLPGDEARKHMYAEHRSLTYALRGWAGGWETAWQGRRRP